MYDGPPGKKQRHKNLDGGKTYLIKKERINYLFHF